jgi:hypothetical protein
VRAVVDDLVSELAQHRRNLVFAREPGVIGGHGDFHTAKGSPDGGRRSDADMKLSCASSAFHAALERGDLTQLEFLDLCARELACDGVVLDVRHFPRTDGDYLAQVKKMAADLGLDVAALRDDAFFGASEEAMNAALQQALAIGAPLLSSGLGLETERSWSEQLERLNSATGLAKAANVTLALRNAPGTFAASIHDCKRVSKEADSAWLRFGLEPLALEAASEPAALESKVVLLWSGLHDDARSLVAQFESFRGHLALDASDGDADAAQMKSAIRTWRIAQNDFELNRK